MILLDTSIWIEALRAGTKLDLEKIAPFEEYVTCLPVIQEVLQGIREERWHRLARESLLSMPIVESPLRVEVWLEASDLYRTARNAGLTIRSSTDCLIAACAIRNDLEVLHRDRDFTALAKLGRLRQRSA